MNAGHCITVLSTISLLDFEAKRRQATLAYASPVPVPRRTGHARVQVSLDSGHEADAPPEMTPATASHIPLRWSFLHQENYPEHQQLNPQTE